MKRSVALFFAFVTGWGTLQAEVTFSPVDLNARSQLVFSAQCTSPAGTSYRAWFRSDLTKKTMEPLTFYPESVVYLAKTGQVQLQNRFGTYRLAADGSRMENVSPDSFEKKFPVTEGKVLPQLFSPDGSLALYQQKTSAVSADLCLYETATGQKTVISSGLLLSFRRLPALWSPDGRYFVYEKAGELYYYSLVQKADGRVPNEGLRKLGKGLISSLSWGSSGDLYYIQDQILYRILPEEFFTRSLYGMQFQTWGVVGKLPFPFRPQVDSFTLAPDRRYVLFNLGGRTLFLYPLDYLDFYQSATLQPLAYLPLPQNLSVRKILWAQGGPLTILTTSLTKGREVSQVIRINGTATQFLDPGKDSVLDIQFSPDERQILLISESGVSVRDAQTFTEAVRFPQDGTVAGFWKDADNLILASRGLTCEIVVKTGVRKTLFLGDVEEAGTSDLGPLAARKGPVWFTYQGQGIWRASAVDLKLTGTLNDSAAYRVYTEEWGTGAYRNGILVRDLAAQVTTPLFPRPEAAYESFPAAEEAPSGLVFTHGSRLRAREVALVIDALDSSEGLPEVLRSLKQWGFGATVFVGGEFLRRNPQAAQEIAASAVETGNLFHIALDFNDKTYVYDKDFVHQGLVRQEDDWFKVTGKELGLLWHPPYWSLEEGLLKGASEANYTTVGRDVSLPAPGARSVESGQLIINLLKTKKPGSILNLTLGLKDSTTGESFFNHLDLLFNALVESGYRVVPVSVLMDRVRH